MTNQYINRVNGIPIQDTELRQEIPHVISEEVLFTIPAADVQTLINDEVIDVSFGGTLDNTKVYYAEYNGKEYKSINVDEDGLYFSSDGFYIEFDVGWDKDWNEDATKTICCLYTPNIITEAADIVIKTKEIQYLKNSLLNPNLTGLESISSVTTIGQTGLYSIAFGKYSKATGEKSFALGDSVEASGRASHAEGSYTTASGVYSHAEGSWSTASTISSHVEGCFTIASGQYQHVQGIYNIEDSESKYAHIVGNGSYATRSNAHTLDWDGNAWYAGDIYAGGTSQDDAEAYKITQETEDETLNKMLEYGLVSDALMLEDGTYLADSDGKLLLF